MWLGVQYWGGGRVFPCVIGPKFVVIGSVCGVYLEMLMCCVDLLLF